MRFLLIAALSVAVAADNKADAVQGCDQLKTIVANLVSLGNDVQCASAVSDDITDPEGACSSVTAAVNAVKSSTTCTDLDTNTKALCEAVAACDFGKKDDPCFPSSAMVTRASGENVAVAALKEGDEILAATAEGTISKDVVSLLSIAKPEASASEYVVLKTVGNYTLTLTEGHHIPVGESCCSKVKVAKEIAVGDVVYVHVRAFGLAPTTVTSKTIGHSSGLHSPVLINGGFPIVNGLVTSFDSIEKVTLAKYGLASLLKACKATGTCDKFRKTFFAEDRKYINA